MKNRFEQSFKVRSMNIMNITITVLDTTNEMYTHLHFIANSCFFDNSILKVRLKINSHKAKNHQIQVLMNQEKYSFTLSGF